MTDDDWTAQSIRAPHSHFYCPCGALSMRATPPCTDARLVVCTLRCRMCGETVQAVPTAWDQP